MRHNGNTLYRHLQRELRYHELNGMTINVPRNSKAEILMNELSKIRLKLGLDLDWLHLQRK